MQGRDDQDLAGGCEIHSPKATSSLYPDYDRLGDGPGMGDQTGKAA